MNIFITGSTGCVAHYVIEQLLRDTDHQLFLFYKNISKFKQPFAEHPRVTLVHGDMMALEPVRPWVLQADVIVHLAAGWISNAAYETNVRDTLELFRMAAEGRCKQVIYFSTASVLDENNRPLQAAGEIGSEYIRSKFQMRQRLSESPLHDRTVVIYPTAIIGGSARHPYSHLGEALQNLDEALRWLRFISLDAGCHFIHAHDLAQATLHFIAQPPTGFTEYVLGHDYLTLRQMLKQLAQAYGYSMPLQISLPTALIVKLVELIKRDMTAWDRFCLQYRHFRNHVTRPTDLGLISPYQTLAQCVAPYVQKKPTV